MGSQSNTLMINNFRYLILNKRKTSKVKYNIQSNTSPWCPRKFGKWLGCWRFQPISIFYVYLSQTWLKHRWHNR